MKTTFYCLLTLICLLQFKYSFAQEQESPRDSIYFHGSEKLEMYVLAPDYHMLTKDNRLQTILKDFQKTLQGIKETVPETYSLDYTHGSKIEILPNTKIASFSISGGKVTRDFRNQAKISDPVTNFQITIGFNDLDTLINTDFDSIVGGIVADLPEKNRYLRYLEFQTDRQMNKPKLVENRPSGYLDMLSLQAGVGANVYRSKFLTDITGELGLQLNQKGILRNQVYLSYNLLFSFNEDNSTVLNSFASIGYRRNLSNQKDKPNWLGIDIGTLVQRNGDIFQPNTMRIGVNWRVAKYITVAPQLYFNGFFKDVSPGFRIGIGL